MSKSEVEDAVQACRRLQPLCRNLLQRLPVIAVMMANPNGIFTNWYWPKGDESAWNERHV